MDVETDISENLLSRIALGQPAEVSVSAIPSKRYRGRLRQVHPDGRPDPRHRQGQGRDPRSRRQALPRAGRDRPLPPQQDRPNSPDASRSFLFVPKSAVFQENGHDYVWVVGAKNVASASGRSRSRRPPTTWRGSSRASKSGESVVLNPLKALHDNEDRPDRRMTAATPVSD